MRSLNQLLDMSGRVAVVTGAAGHVGGVAAHTMAEMGASVVLVDLDEEGTNANAEALRRSYGTDTSNVIADLSNQEEIQAIPAAVKSKFGRTDVLINCAAIVGADNREGWATTFQNQDSALWENILMVNLTSVFTLSQGCAVSLAAGQGSIINIASIYGIVGHQKALYEDTAMGSPAGYAASKGGILQLTRWLAVELGPHVRVNAISPGGIERGQPEVFQRKYAERTPLGRMATEEDLKGAIAFLASDLSSYVTGHNLVVDGGWTAW